jgi:hypothetical protein
MYTEEAAEGVHDEGVYWLLAVGPHGTWGAVSYYEVKLFHYLLSIVIVNI